MHNERVRPTTGKSEPSLTWAVVAVTTLGLLLASCSDSETANAPEPSPSASASQTSAVDVPADTSLTEGGETLRFGDPATVVFEPNQQRGTVLELTVDSAAQGTLKDFSGFILDDKSERSTPYYVDVSVQNVGKGDVGDFAVPLFGVDDDDLLLQASAFTTKFEKCESQPLPKTFSAGDSFKTCLVYLAPQRGTLESVSFRPSEEFDPIVWTGDIAKPSSDKPEKPKQPRNPKKKQR